MPQDRNTPHDDSSNTHKVIEEHLNNKDHEITDEHIRNVKVGIDEEEPAPLGAEIESRFEGDMIRDKSYDEKTSATPNPNALPDAEPAKENPGTKPPNPWEVIG